DRFKQGDSDTSRRQAGLGLGLALVEHLVELHGGSVAVESAGVGQGATFIVSLPVRAVKAVTGAEKERPKLAGLRGAGREQPGSKACMCWWWTMSPALVNCFRPHSNSTGYSSLALIRPRPPWPQSSLNLKGRRLSRSTY